VNLAFILFLKKAAMLN